jgi:NADH:ubiquinone oxidoreductase subunit D
LDRPVVPPVKKIAAGSSSDVAPARTAPAVPVAAANGELGYYIVSDGSKHPWRVKVRPPCYNIYQAYPQMIKGGLIADAVAIIGGLNVVAGELDR